MKRLEKVQEQEVKDAHGIEHELNEVQEAPWRRGPGGRGNTDHS